MNAVVVGGGLAGLVAARELEKAGVRVTVLERDLRLGGQVRSTRVNGLLIEHGAEGYASARAAGNGLCRSLGISKRLTSQSTSRYFQLRGRRLVPAPPGRAAKLAGIQAEAGEVGRGLTSLVDGMGELIEALSRVLADRVDLQVGASVCQLAPQPTGWTLATESGCPRNADAVILAIPAAEAARLLKPFAPEAAATLAACRTVSTVSVSLAFERSAVGHPLEGAGFVSTAGPETPGFRACTFASSQFPGRAAPGHVLLRAFFRPGPRYPLEAPDARWVDHALRALGPVLRISGDPVGTWVARWPDALPRYSPNHSRLVGAAIRRASPAGSPLALAGAAYRRAGVAGAIESARSAARRVLRALDA